MKKALLLVLAVAFLAGMGFNLLPSKTSAFSPNYNQSSLIDNGTFLDKNTMSAGQIQAFLNNVGSGIKNYSDVERCSSRTAPYYHHCNQRISAAQIIYDAAHAYSINPRAIIATMQKEEGLITNPNPTSSEITYAMGYGCPDSSGCSGYAGFFNQVDNGTWQFRVDYELSSGHSWWGYSPSSYPCSGSTRYYTPGLLPGNTVSFKDDYGTVYKRFKLNNASTATLYCYTPHAYPGSSREYYSGSYWFVYYFQKWFGSTQATTAYAAIVEGQSTYSDSGRTKAFSNTPTVAPGGSYYMTVTARNIGYQSWSQSFMRIGTLDPKDRSSQFYDSSWVTASRPTSMSESSVGPGDSGTFNFTLKAPAQTGSYKECFGLVADGHAWLNTPSVCFNLNVVSPISASSATNMTVNSTLTPGHYILSPDKQSTLILQKDGNLVLYSNFKAQWSSRTAGKSSSKLILQSDGNLVLYDRSNKALWHSHTNGNSGDHLSLQTDGNLVIYSGSNGALWATRTVQNPNNLGYVNTYFPDALLYPGQKLETADRRYYLILQTNGDLVLYTNANKAIWHSRTMGKGTAYLNLQSDGNLVLYNGSNHALWSSRTAGNQGDVLLLQQDGNLVLYNRYWRPVWNTHTSGVH